MTNNGNGQPPEALREEIRRTRMELGETVEALAARADVKARLRHGAEQTRERIREQAGQAVRGLGRVRGAGGREQVAYRGPMPWALLAAGAVATMVVLVIVRGRRG